MVNDDDVPEGQAAINELLAECYELLHQLRVQNEEDADANDDDGDSEEGN